MTPLDYALTMLALLGALAVPAIVLWVLWRVGRRERPWSGR